MIIIILKRIRRFLLAQRNREIVLKKHKKKNVFIADTCRVSPYSEFEGNNAIHDGSSFSGKMGYGSYIGQNSILNASIGRFCSIGRNVSSNYGRHPYKEPYISSSPVFYSIGEQVPETFSDREKFQETLFSDEEHKYGITIENDCWIGDNVFIVGGIKISNGAVVLANAVVTKNIPPYAIVGGVPAKIIGYRFSNEIIQKLLKCKWWNKEISWIKKHAADFCNLENFTHILEIQDEI